MIEHHKTKAGELALALSWGYADISEAVEWADCLIASSEVPDDRLTEVSLAGSKSKALSTLNSLSSGANYWLVLSLFLRRFSKLDGMTPEEASRLAERLFHPSLRPDAPLQFQAFTSHWDDIDLAISGQFGDPNRCVAEFLNDVREASKL